MEETMKKRLCPILFIIFALFCSKNALSMKGKMHPVVKLTVEWLGSPLDSVLQIPRIYNEILSALDGCYVGIKTLGIKGFGVNVAMNLLCNSSDNAVERGDLNRLKLITKIGGKFLSKKKVTSLLIEAAYFRHFDIVKYLVEKKNANVNGFSTYSETPTPVLYEAVLGLRNGHSNDNKSCEKVFKIVKYLVQKGANVNCESKRGSILSCALRYARPALVEYLIKKGAITKAVSKEFVNYGLDEFDQFSSCRKQKFIDFIKLLIANGLGMRIDLDAIPEKQRVSRLYVQKICNFNALDNKIEFLIDLIKKNKNYDDYTMLFLADAIEKIVDSVKSYKTSILCQLNKKMNSKEFNSKDRQNVKKAFNKILGFEVSFRKPYDKFLEEILLFLSKDENSLFAKAARAHKELKKIILKKQATDKRMRLKPDVKIICKH